MDDRSDSDGADRPPEADVAIIVVHGVADQQPGETARAFIETMVASAPNGARYVAGDTQDFTLPVPPLAYRFPGEPSEVRSGDANLTDGATPTTRERGLLKAFSQSIKSDFHRPEVEATDTQAGQIDRGLAFTHYLLRKSLRNGAPAAHYASQRTRLRRQAGSTAGDRDQAIDVYEMYWADQSRLAGALPRIVTELFTMFFRLSRLGRDAVEEASRHAGVDPARDRGSWRLLSRLQTLIDWGFTNLLAQLFFQLLLVGLFLLVLGAATPEPAQAVGSEPVAPDRLHRLVGGIVSALGLVSAAYFRGARRRALVAMGSAAVGGLMVLLPALGFGIALLCLLTAFYVATLRWADDRFPFIFYSGCILWTGLIATTLVRAAGAQAGNQSDWAALLDAGLTAFEYLLFAIKWWFIAFGVVFALWAALSAALTWQARHQNDWQLRGSAGTGQLGALVSVASFLLVAMSLWAALGAGLGLALKGNDYQPALCWPQDPSPATAAAAASSTAAAGTDCKVLKVCCPDIAEAKVDAVSFAELRFTNSTETFALNALLMAVVLGYLLLLLTPSVLAELQLVTSGSAAEARRLGRWLTWFYRHLDLVVLGVTLSGAAAAVLVAGYFFSGVTLFNTSTLSDASQAILKWFVIPAASALGVLSVLGGVLSRWAPGLRAPLDAALDVDNYMREFPRRAIPRARIFARYAALLQEVSDRAYGRIVIVSHSQGTVISTELLRYLSSENTALGQTGRARRLKARLGCDSIHLLTLGCPLRQLYAARFPSLYAWVLNQAQQPNGPCADDVGVDRWFNAFGSGDYVGRWLWSRHADAFHPLNDGLEPAAALGRETTYDDVNPLPPEASAMQSLRELETCIGFAAHTHYFDPPHQAASTPTVTLLADELVAGTDAASRPG